MKRFNWNTAQLQTDEGDPEGFAVRYAAIGREIGAQHLGGQLIEVEPGKRSFPYHREAGQEEWLLVLSGAPSLRAPEGVQPLRAGDLVCFPVGPEGAHQVINDGSEPARVIFFSDRRDPNVIIYPDSGKVGVRGDLGLPGSANYRIADHIDYWEGE